MKCVGCVLVGDAGASRINDVCRHRHIVHTTAGSKFLEQLTTTFNLANPLKYCPLQSMLYHPAPLLLIFITALYSFEPRLELFPKLWIYTNFQGLRHRWQITLPAL